MLDKGNCIVVESLYWRMNYTVGPHLCGRRKDVFHHISYHPICSCPPVLAMLQHSYQSPCYQGCLVSSIWKMSSCGRTRSTCLWTGRSKLLYLQLSLQSAGSPPCSSHSQDLCDVFYSNSEHLSRAFYHLPGHMTLSHCLYIQFYLQKKVYWLF